MAERETPTPLATAYPFTSANVGTSLTTVAGTISALSVTVLPTVTDKDTQICLTDGPNGRTIWAATIAALAFLWEPRPNVPLTPGITAPVYPRSLIGAGTTIPVSNGIYVKSCPANISMSVSA